MSHIFLPDKFLQQLETTFSSSLPEIQNILCFQDELIEISDWGLKSFLLALQENHLLAYANKLYHVDEIIEKLSVLPIYHKLLNTLLARLVDKGLLNMPNQQVYALTLQATEITKQSISKENSMLARHLGLAAHIQLLEATLENYLPILAGKEIFLSILFPKGSFEVVNKIYQDNPAADFYNKLTAIIIRDFLTYTWSKKNKTPLNVLEVGAGIGSTTAQALPLLKPLAINEYHYTDISAAFLAYGIEKFSNEYDFLLFSKFNINQPAQDQKFGRESYDAIFATNAIHNACNLNETIMELYSMLRPGGVLVLNEGIIRSDYSTIVYGLSSNWWSFTDDNLRIKNSPLLSTALWKNLLAMAPFNKIFSLNEILFPGIKMDQDIIVAIK